MGSTEGASDKVRAYFFGLRWSDHEDDDANGTLLSDDAAALNYADRLIRQLKDAGGYSDPNLTVIVRDGMFLAPHRGFSKAILRTGKGNNDSTSAEN
jgi:hypothetical protein